MKVLLDTHVLLWWQAGGDKLSRAAMRAIDRADAALISAISFWEMSVLIESGKISVGRPLYRWVDDLFATQGVEPVAVDPRIAMTAGRVIGEGLHGDPADSIIYATAREHAVPLVTKDGRIAEHAAGRRDIAVVW